MSIKKELQFEAHFNWSDCGDVMTFSLKLPVDLSFKEMNKMANDYLENENNYVPNDEGEHLPNGFEINFKIVLVSETELEYFGQILIFHTQADNGCAIHNVNLKNCNTIAEMELAIQKELTEIYRQFGEDEIANAQYEICLKVDRI